MVTYNICYDVAAFVMLLVIILLFLIRRGTSNYQNRLFFALVFCAFLGTSADIIDILFLNATAYIPVYLKYLSSGSCFLLHGLEAMLVMFYFLGITNSWWKTKLFVKMALIIPYICTALFIITSFRTKLIYYFDEAGVYHRGSACMFTYMLALFYLLIATVYICYLRKFLSRDTHIILLFIMAIAATGAIIQLSVPGMTTQMFSTALSLYIMFFTLQNPFLSIDSYLRVYNRSAFVHMTSLNFATGKKMTVLFLSINDFAFLQSSFGVEPIRRMLRELARKLKTLERNILVYHVSEFCFCLVPNGNYPQSRIGELADKIEQLFEKPWEINEVLTMLTIHICRVDCPKEAESVEEIFEIGSCLPEQKQSGTRVLVSEMDIKGRSRKRQREQRVKDTIADSKYEVCCRGLYSLLMNKTNSAELSLRVSDTEGGYLYSNDCKELLEKTGLIFQVGVILFQEACKFISSGSPHKRSFDSVEIGISIFLCMQSEYLQEITDLMRQYDIKPGMIRLKISESEAMDSTKQLQKMMNRYSELGVWFSLDGYGTGYSNISYIYELPFSHIEIDKEVFQAALTDSKAMDIMKNSIQMLHELDMQVVIGDAAAKEEQDLLCDMGCDYVIEEYSLI